jgi:phosphoribosylaminoimidazole (AIR) synthetase
MLTHVFLRVLEKSGLSLSDPLPRNDGISTTVGEALMAPTVIYVKQVGFCPFIYVLRL